MLCRWRLFLEKRNILILTAFIVSSFIWCYPTKDICDNDLISSNATMILVVGYMRSGSTLTGDILQQATNNFYAFEPVHDVTDVILLKKPVIYLDGSKRYLNVSNIKEIHTDLLYKWFTCSLSSIDLGSLVNSDMLFQRKTVRYYYNCKGPLSSVKSCLWYLANTCNSATVRTMKVIRVSMESVKILLEKLQNLKIIHLLRDPRAIFHSQLQAKLIRTRDLKNQAKNYCMNMMNDMEITEKLLLKFPGRVKPLLYESLAEDPLVKSKTIYQYLGLKYSDSIERYIEDITVSGKESACLWCTQKGNSTKTSRQWRKYINFNHLSVIDKYCRHVYEKAGYVHVTSQKDLRNISFSLRKITRFMSQSL